MTAPKDEQAEAFTLEDIIKMNLAPPRKTRQSLTQQRHPSPQTKRPWIPSPLHNRNQRNRRNRSKNRPRQMRLRKKYRTHRQTPPQKRHWNLPRPPRRKHRRKSWPSPSPLRPVRHAVRPPP